MSADRDPLKHYTTLAAQAAGEPVKVDVLSRILNCGESMRDVHDVVAELIERDRIATEVFTCILRGVNDLSGSMGYRSLQYVPDWLQLWAKSMHTAGFKPLNSKARDISVALARIGSTP